MEHDALFYEKINNKAEPCEEVGILSNPNKVKCFLCPHNCVIADGKFGLCSVRKNIDGVLETVNYGEITSIAVDPIEKKPLYHFMPGKNILSVGSYGCNFSCEFCQNYSIAKEISSSQYVSPEELIDVCINQNNNVGIAFTYNEPTVWYEYIYDTAKKLKELYPEKKNVLVTNGYIQQKPLEKILPYVDAMNIDLKSYQEVYYKKICRGELKPVLKTIETTYEKCHIEITTLMVNDLNVSENEIKNIASFIAELNPNIPLHLTRYYPAYKMDLPPTEIEKMILVREIAKKYLNYVYLGNISSTDNSTYCPNCSKLLIERRGYKTKVYIEGNQCKRCGFGFSIRK